MSSPIASREKGPFKSGLIKVHQKFSHSRRIETIARRIADIIQEHFPVTEEIRCLDVGCGDMKIAERVGTISPNTNWSCIDIYDIPDDLRDSERWRKYRRFDGTNIPYEDNAMNIVLLCDVLHHVQTNAQALLAEAARVSSLVLVKDHFEYSLYSRIMLLAMDFLGNWGYGVSLPEQYFTRKSFDDLLRRTGLLSKQTYVGIDLYAHIPLARTLLNPKWQFISVLVKDSREKN